MLSKTSIVIMGMLSKGEMNAYDMLKMIEKMNMKYWFPIGATTLYETCIRLEKKNYIENTGESDKKAIYHITEEGLRELKSTICALFERVDFDSVWFCLAVMYSGVLDKKELKREIMIRTKILDEYEKGTIANKELMLKEDVSYIEVCAIDRMIQIIRMEKETLERFAKNN
ncbi:MAG: PadR family transcriptional regulator [Clostridia bacterium]|nr:PadR family transcriptional regulator [Clostridia bacterium]